MSVATFLGKEYGTDYAAVHVYGSWWFCLLWGVSAALGIMYFLKSKTKKLSVICLHLSFIIILAGALLTHLFSEQGYIHVREGETIHKFTIEGKDILSEKELPFSLTLNDFEISYHDGTTAHKDYQSKLELIDGNQRQNVVVSMNHICSYRSVRLYQMSYDDDEKGSYLSVNIDPWGIPVTYIGYALLFFSLIWILVDPTGTYRRLWNHPLLKKGVLMGFILFGFNISSDAAEVLPKETARKFAELHCLYNNRISLVQTLALDFTKKIYHKRSYKGYSAEQVLTGFMFFGDSWDDEPVIRVKNGQMRRQFNLDKYTSLRSFFKDGNYILGPTLQEYYKGNSDSFHKAVADIDDKLQLILSIRRGTPLKLFPYTDHQATTWYSSDMDIPSSVPEADRFLMKNLLSVFKEDAAQKNESHFLALLTRVKDYQHEHAGLSLPTKTQDTAEKWYNKIPFATVLFMFNLTMGFITLFYMLYRLTRAGEKKGNRYIIGFSALCALLSWAALTVCEGLRWVISGEIPMRNGYETMLLLAWFILLITLLTYRRCSVVLTFGFLLSGFFLLVSHIGQMDPQITPMMPVLASPLLSIHVSVIMMSFALLSLTFLCGVMALLLYMIERKGHPSLPDQLEALQLLSRLFLYPALSMLGIGIFVGAIWANISWGHYWSWDPKEVWALITLMVYAIAVHTKSFPTLRKPLNYHVFMTLAFLMVLMTYFGVNYFLGGMHSYA